MSVAGVTRKATQRFTREQSCERGEPSTIGRGVPGARDLTTKYGELMSKHGDLDVLLVWGGTDSKQCEQPSNEEEGDRIVHVDDRGRSKGPLVSARITCLHPSRYYARRLTPEAPAKDVRVNTAQDFLLAPTRSCSANLVSGVAGYPAKVLSGSGDEECLALLLHSTQPSDDLLHAEVVALTDARCHSVEPHHLATT